MYSTPYILDNVGKDFDHFYYDRKTWKLVEDPDGKDVVDAALGESTSYLNEKVNNLERRPFCNFIQDLSKPKDDAVAQQCKVEINNRGARGRFLLFLTK